MFGKKTSPIRATAMLLVVLSPILLVSNVALGLKPERIKVVPPCVTSNGCGCPEYTDYCEYQSKYRISCYGNGIVTVCQDGWWGSCVCEDWEFLI